MEISSQPMVFSRHGRAYHLKVGNSADLKNVLSLDEAHWVATGAPVSGLTFDPDLLYYLDSDCNGRIMCYEIKEAIEWLFGALSDVSGIDRKSDVLKFSSLNTDDSDGSAILQAAKKILKELGTPDVEEISLEQVRKVESSVEKTPVCEAGVVPPEAAEDAAVKQFVTDIIETVGGVDYGQDGKGVDVDKLKEFMRQAQARLDWHKKSLLPNGKSKSDIMPLGKDTIEAYKIYIKLADKIEQYFAQCKAMAFDGRIAEHVKAAESEMAEADLCDPAVIEELIKKEPLAEADKDCSLLLNGKINPYYEESVELFRKQVVHKMLSKQHNAVTEKEWENIKETFAAHHDWIESKDGGDVECLGLDKLGAYLDSKHGDAVNDLIKTCDMTALALGNIHLVEKLILYQAELIAMVNNFVSFPDLYDPERRAAFEMGTLIIDGRHLNFSIKVDDLNAHSAIAKTSDIFVIYVEVLPDSAEGDTKSKYIVALPVTSGTAGNLCVGKRGVFLDLSNKLLDARVVKIIENPISVTETLVAPFKRIGKLISGKIESITTTAEKKLDSVATNIAAPQPAVAQPSRGMLAGGMLMGGGVAIAALMAAISKVIQTVGEFGVAQSIFGILIAIGAVMLPATIMAIKKLGMRDMSSILEGSGWAINARMRLTHKQGIMFTKEPKFPKGSKGVLNIRIFVISAIMLVLAVIVGKQIVDKKREADKVIEQPISAEKVTEELLPAYDVNILVNEGVPPTPEVVNPAPVK